MPSKSFRSLSEYSYRNAHSIVACSDTCKRYKVQNQRKANLKRVWEHNQEPYQRQRAPNASIHSR